MANAVGIVRAIPPEARLLGTALEASGPPPSLEPNRDGPVRAPNPAVLLERQDGMPGADVVPLSARTTTRHDGSPSLQGDGVEDLPCRAVNRRISHRHPGFDDAGLFERDLLERVAEN